MICHELAHGIAYRVKRKTQPHLYQPALNGCNGYGVCQRFAFWKMAFYIFGNACLVELLLDVPIASHRNKDIPDGTV